MVKRTEIPGVPFFYSVPCAAHSPWQALQNRGIPRKVLLCKRFFNKPILNKLNNPILSRKTLPTRKLNYKKISARAVFTTNPPRLCSIHLKPLKIKPTFSMKKPVYSAREKQSVTEKPPINQR